MRTYFFRLKQTKKKNMFEITMFSNYGIKFANKIINTFNILIKEEVI